MLRTPKTAFWTPELAVYISLVWETTQIGGPNHPMGTLGYVGNLDCVRKVLWTIPAGLGSRGGRTPRKYSVYRYRTVPYLYGGYRVCTVRYRIYPVQVVI